MYLHKLDEMVDKYNNRDQGAIIIKHAEVTLNSFIDFDVEDNVKDL